MIALSAADPGKSSIDTLVIPVCEDKDLHRGPVADLVQEVRRVHAFSGETGERLTRGQPERGNIRCAVFIGVGKAGDLDAEAWRKFAGRAVGEGMARKLKGLHMAVPWSEATGMAEAELIAALAEGACLGNHVFDRYKAEKKRQPLEKITLLTGRGAVRAHKRLVERVETVCAGTRMAREWVSTPSNDKVPEAFAAAVAAAAKGAGLKTTVLDEKALRRKGFGALLAVAAGSDHPPALAVLEHKPRGAKKTVVLVGKGVTFDSGGINLKPAGSQIEEMKMDMAGAAAVAAALITVARLNPLVHVVGVLPLVENMPSGRATRPGDIIKSFAGKTVEIGNTDAEGRLILIDALAWAVEQYKPDAVLDLATLTGACVVALGEKIAGLFSADDDLAEAVLAAAARTGERCWRLPLPEDYKEQIKSEFADISNMGATRWGGAITAALFLSAFVEKARWAHIDIAGPAYSKKASDYAPAGGTGFGVRLLLDLLERI
ncbi:MAG: leucyl aminopeptidase [Deltaproteobacteria bacterium]|nr:leucyl aminopeptidase [Deltaproteobacteria bacterium]MBW2355502.1 leucyl aminopeptidase [Deltaproteobacteria bacterium]